jgi:hypothetical protein
MAYFLPELSVVALPLSSLYAKYAFPTLLGLIVSFGGGAEHGTYLVFSSNTSNFDLEQIHFGRNSEPIDRWIFQADTEVLRRLGRL